MKGHKNLLTAGVVIGSLAVLLLAFNFLNMYSLAGKCPDDITTNPCSAHDNWVLLNKIGLFILVVGIVISTIGYIKYRRQRSEQSIGPAAK
jgi:uncharacterized membrane protein YidH (DUF202 family)